MRREREENTLLCSDVLSNVHAQIASNGWASVQRINTTNDLVALARLLGTPIPNASGEVVRSTRPTLRKNARSMTLSAEFGTGSFPLHTDTAFWPMPARFIIMSVIGDLRRRTTIYQFRKITDSLGTRSQHEIATSVWRVPSVCGGIYCSMQFHAGVGYGWRYDARCMRPMNSSARTVEKLMQAALEAASPDYFTWSNGMALVLSNWQVLHGREVGPSNEELRELRRVYVK